MKKDIMKIFDVCDSILLNNSDTNFFYLSGIDERIAGMSLFQKDKLELILPMIEKQRAEKVIEKKRNISIKVFKDESDLKKALSQANGIIGVNYKSITKKNYDILRKFVKGKIVDISKELEYARMVKNRDEIKKIIRACKISSLVMNNAIDYMKNKITERELATYISCLIKKKKCEPGFEPIAASGKNSSFPHHTSNNKIIKKSSILLLDIGVRYKNYNSDMTRMLFVRKWRERIAHDAVLDAQNTAIDMIQDGIKASDVYNAALNVIKKYDKGFNFIHSLGHGIGLDVHESPSLTEKNENVLMKGMVLTLEPALYFNDFGIRIEDVVLITKNGCRTLTR